MHNLTSEQLIQKWYEHIDEGEDDRADLAYAELFRRHQGVMSGLARRCFPRPADADDVAQDLWLAVAATGHKPSSRWKPGTAKVSTWLTTILRNKMRDRQRKQRVISSVEGPGSFSDPDEPGFLEIEDYRGEAPEDVLSRDERQEEVRQAVEELPDDLRRVVELRYYEGLKQTEIAARMDRSEPWVSTKLSAARGALCDRLQALAVVVE